MSEAFLHLIEQVRGGDEQATTRLVDQYGQVLRRAIRLQMLDSRLRRVIGESDIFQSVISRFLFDLWAGRYEFDHPDQLAALLKKMAVARVTDAARHHTAQRRDLRRNQPGSVELAQAPQPATETPSQIVAKGELLHTARALLTERERQILDLRHDRASWQEIATHVGKSPEAARKEFERAVQRVAEQLGLGED